MIRRIKPSDYKAIYSINQRCHRIYEPNIDLLYKLQTGFTWVAEENGKVMGFLISRIVEDKLANIYNVSVLPEYRGQGIATALFKECHEFYRGNSLCLHVNVNNPAQKLYFDLGYRVLSIKENFYGDGENAIHMCKVLGAPVSPR